MSGNDRKNGRVSPFDGKKPCWKRIRWKYVRFCLGNDKSNANTDKVLFYF